MSVLFRLDGAVAGQARYGPEPTGYKGYEQDQFIEVTIGGNGPLQFAHEAEFGILKEYAGYLWEPGANATHTLTAEVADGCGYGGGSASEHFTVNSITVDVLGTR